MGAKSTQRRWRSCLSQKGCGGEGEGGRGGGGAGGTARTLVCAHVSHQLHHICLGPRFPDQLGYRLCCWVGSSLSSVSPVSHYWMRIQSVQSVSPVSPVSSVQSSFPREKQIRATPENIIGGSKILFRGMRSSERGGHFRLSEG